jgi:hypothetical protein
VEDLDVYLVGTGDKAIVAIYDIFGLEFPQASPDVLRVAAAPAAAAAVTLLPGLHNQPQLAMHTQDLLPLVSVQLFLAAAWITWSSCRAAHP